MRRAARAARGRAARRRRRLAERLRPARAPDGRQARGATSCCSGCSSRATSASRSTTRRSPSRSRSAPTSRPPVEKTASPYFTSWVRQQVVDQLGGGQVGARQAFEGGLTVQTTIDVELQQAAQRAISASSCPGRAARAPRWSRIDNKTGEVRAMVRRRRLRHERRSTSPPRASASRARRSSRSCSPRRSRTASPPAPSGRRTSSRSTLGQSEHVRRQELRRRLRRA